MSTTITLPEGFLQELEQERMAILMEIAEANKRLRLVDEKIGAVRVLTGEALKMPVIERQASGHSAIENAVLAFLRSNGNSKPTEIKEGLRAAGIWSTYSPTSLTVVLSNMKDKRLIFRTQRGVYSMTEANNA